MLFYFIGNLFDLIFNNEYVLWIFKVLKCGVVGLVGEVNFFLYLYVFDVVYIVGVEYCFF